MSNLLAYYHMKECVLVWHQDVEFIRVSKQTRLLGRAQISEGGPPPSSAPFPNCHLILCLPSTAWGGHLLQGHPPIHIYLGCRLKELPRPSPTFMGCPGTCFCVCLAQCLADFPRHGLGWDRKLAERQDTFKSISRGKRLNICQKNSVLENWVCESFPYRVYIYIPSHSCTDSCVDPGAQFVIFSTANWLTKWIHIHFCLKA